MSRETCWRCFWPAQLCWCPSIIPQATRTRFIFLMHPKEFKREKAATGRFAHLSLSNSEIHMGVGFDDNQAVQALISDPNYHAVLLYPGPGAWNLSRAGLQDAPISTKPLTVFLLDGTWATAKTMFRSSQTLQNLPRLMFETGSKSRYSIKKQPHDWCLSTLEATHELLLALETAGLDHYDHPDAMLRLFERMQDFQIVSAAVALQGDHPSSYRTARSS